MNLKRILGIAGALIGAAYLAYENGELEAFLGGQQSSERTIASSQQRAPTQTGGGTRETGGEDGFDYYVLALSWSPSFCEDSGDRTSNQCNGSRDYGFVAHGLWPQYENGWPEFCDISARVPERTIDKMLPIMPSKGLIFHQWKKHGTCSGMQPRDYFDTVKAAYEAVVIPKELRRLDRTLTIDPQVIEAAFIESNPALDRDEIVINCSKNRLREVKVCFDKALTPRACGSDVNRECRSDAIRMPPVR